MDLIDSTALATRLDPEDLQQVLGGVHAVVAEAVGQFDGRVVHVEGDGLLACFGWPAAHEDDAERAVRASIAAIAAVGRLVTGADLSDGPTIYADAPHLASQLHAFGPPGSIGLADGARRALGDLFAFASLGARPPKGLETPVEAWLLLGEGTEESRFEALRRTAVTPLVGRRQDLALLLDRWRRARAGEGQVFLLSGAPGIGKSRLAWALRERLVAVPDHWTVGQAIDWLRAKPDLPDDFYDVFLIDPRFRVVGDVPLSRLMRTRRAVPLTDIKYKELRTFPAQTDQEEIARAFRRYALHLYGEPVPAVASSVFLTPMTDALAFLDLASLFLL